MNIANHPDGPRLFHILTRYLIANVKIMSQKHVKYVYQMAYRLDSMCGCIAAHSQTDSSKLW